MKRLSKILIIMNLLALPVMAQVDTTIVLSDLIINGNTISIPFSESSRNVQIISKNMINNQPAQSIPEILSYAPGVDIRQRGPVGVQADIGIRGGTFEQTLILLNGIKLTDPQTGHHIMNIPISIDNIQQVEVLKGPGARVFGQNAFAGAVNFITKIPDQRKLGLRAYGGSFGSYGFNASVALPSKSYKQFLSLGRDASDGYQHNTDYGINNIFYQSELPVGQGALGLIFGLTDRKFGANGFYASPDYTEQYEEVRTSLTSLDYKQTFDNFEIKPRIYWRWNRDKYLFIRNKPGAYQNLHKTNTLGVEINNTYHNSLGISGFGLEFRKEMINGDWVRGGNESKSNLDGFERNNFGFYANQKFNMGNRFDITPGVYLNWYSDFGWNAFPGIDAGFQLSDKVRIYGNIGQSYRVPTFYDQYYSSPVEQGNPDLKPEDAFTYETGIRYINNGMSMDINYFVRDASQLIDWVYDTTDSLWRSQNFANVTTSGLEISWSIDFLKLIDKDFLVNSVMVSYNFLDQKMDNPEDIQSRYSLENIRNQIIVGVDHKILGKLKNSFKIRYIDRVEQSPYYLLDDRLSYEQNSRLKIFLEATNLTDQKYTEVMTQMPGRWFRFGINLNVSL